MFPIKYSKGTVLKLYDSLVNFHFDIFSNIKYIIKGEVDRHNSDNIGFHNGPSFLNFAFFRKHRNIKSLIVRFKKSFPKRKDQLNINDIFPYLETGRVWAQLFSHFDVIQCYGAHPIWGLISGTKVPYVCLEHGTLRDFTMGNVGIHRIISLAYKESKHTFITNGDCIKYAKKLKLNPHSAMIHPLDLEPFRTEETEAISKLRHKYEADVLLFCPIRHDWKIKGVNTCIESLPFILEKTDKRVKLVLCEWGKEIDRSKELIKTLGLTDNVIWIRPLSKIPLARHLKAADVVLDQMTLPHFGGTAPQALAAGTPVIMSYRPKSTAWMFSEPAPILAAFTPQEIANCAIKALDKKWLKEFRITARNWIDTYHSTEFLLNEHMKVYKKVLKDKLTLKPIPVKSVK